MYDRTARCAAIAALALTIAAPLAAQQTVKIPAKDIALKDRPTNVFTVGTEEGEEWEMFSGIRSAAFDRADNLYLLDGQNTRVVVFDARGRYVRHFGKKGGGPGELQAPRALEILADGNVVVSDLANRAFIIFKPTGEYVRNVPFAESLGMPMSALYADSRGGIVARSMPRMRPVEGQPASDNMSPIFRQQLTGASDAAATTLYKVATPPPQNMGDQGPGQRAFIRMDPVFGPRPTFGLLPDGGIALHHETEYAIRVIDANGRHTRTLTREFRPRKVTKKDQEEWQKRSREGGASAGPGAMIMTTVTGGGSGTTSIGAPGAAGGRAPSGEAMRLSLENTPFAEFMSVVSSTRTDPQGRIWVQRRNADGTAEGPIDLIAADGRYIGTLPAQALPAAVSASGLAAWVVTDDLGVERVTVRRLPQSWR